MSKKKFRIIILAAGRGTRMESNLPKVLHKLDGIPMIHYVINTAKKLKPDIINIVYGYKGYLLKSIIHDNSISWVFQKKPLGTGDAIKKVINKYSSENEDVLILYGDIPLISTKTLKKLYKIKPKNGISLLTKKINYPNGYGRVLRKNGKVIKIIEHKEANAKELLINEINIGIFIANSLDLKKWLKSIKNKNANKEYYITDIIYFAYKEKKKIKTISPIYNQEYRGVNNVFQLVILEKIYQKIKIKKLLSDGLIIQDTKKFDLRGKLLHGKNVFIDINVNIQGTVKLGNNVTIGIGCIIKNSNIGNHCTINAYCIIENSVILNHCIIGPFAILTDNNKLCSKTIVGNFVQIKRSILGEKSKAKHLSYLGDAYLGKKVNIGAGTVTCNFDGIKKNKTIIKDNVFVGSNTQLIAPIKISKNTVIAAGTTVIKNVNHSYHKLIYNPIKQMKKNKFKKIKK